MALIPDDVLDAAISKDFHRIPFGGPATVSNPVEVVQHRTADFIVDLARELKACRKALREIDRAACVETSDPATGAISSLARACLPEHKEAPDA